MHYYQQTFFYDIDLVLSMSSWDSAVIIAINYGLEDQGMRV
jgi:hypothetical protein